ncbi:multicopper oxidase family protein [Cadophora sp. MPI-SDFR-AT-0126]|nr:multicopper oxidase family protein [Leotiomycetes sp. MPI-SDFR-AT-0126]
MKDATGIFETGSKTGRRRLSSFCSTSTSAEHNNEPSRQFLGNEEIFAHPFEPRPDNLHRHRDASRWLRPLGWLFGIIFIAVVISNSLSILLWKSTTLFTSEATSDESNPTGRKLGIELHPEDHVSRHPTTITHHWNITSGVRYPDGVRKEVYLVNDLFPGPTIECRPGDRLLIHVTNSLASEGVSIHWHGLEMRGANEMDGAVGITQCHILPEKSFIYDFVIGSENFGTFWWHAHSQVQRGDGMYGGLVVHRPAEKSNDMGEYKYEKDVLVMIGDWYHRSAEEVLAWYTSARGFGNEPVPDSLLVNGFGKFVCSMAVPARPVECVDRMKGEVLSLFGSPDNRAPVRLRFVNVGSLAGFTVQLSSANLTPLAVDGGSSVLGHASSSVGILYPGERVDLLLDWDTHSTTTSPELRVFLDPENFKYPNQALRQNQSFPVFDFVPTSNKDLPMESSSNHFDLATAHGAPRSGTIPPTAHQTLLLYAKTQKLSISNNHPSGFMNRTTWSPQSNPALPLISLPHAEWDENQLIPYIPLSLESETWVDIIINNLDDGAHPFHLHGYSFYVLATHRSKYGWGSYNPYSHAAGSSRPEINIENPVRKDTVSVPRRGYVIIRFKAENVGIWMLHCHVLFHQASGMAMGIQVGGEEDHGVVNIAAKSLCSNSS